MSSVLLPNGLALAGCGLTRTDSWPRTSVAYVPYWDQQRGFKVVHQHADMFDQVSPMWYSLDENGDVVPADDEYVAVDIDEVRYLQNAGMKVLPTLVDLRNGSWAPNLVRAVLRDPAARARHIDGVVRLVETMGYDGVDVDYEQLGGGDRELYSAFLTDLGAAIHRSGKLITATAYPKESEPGPYEHNLAQDYTVFGSVSDQVRVMAYDYHYTTSSPGPVAPADWVERCIAWAVTVVPASKVILGLVTLGYDWINGGQGQPITHEDALARAQMYGATIRRDADQSATFDYVDERGIGHVVWFEDAQSTAIKLRLVEKYGLGGAFFWRLGGEDEDTWKLLAPGQE